MELGLNDPGSGLLRVCLRKARRTEIMIEDSRVSRNTMKKTSGEEEC